MVTINQFCQLALQWEDVIEMPHFHKRSFRIGGKKIFATLDEVEAKAVVKLPEAEQSIFSAVAKTVIYPVANAWGKQGWTVVELKKVKKELLAEALSIAYNYVTTGVSIRR